MPALINAAANLVLGGSLAYVTRRSPAVRQEVISWALLLLVGFEALVVTPVATYLFRFYPQWSMLYWFDPQMFPSLDSWVGVLSLLAVLVNFSAALGGFFVTREGILTNRRWLVYAPMAAGGAVALVTLAFGARRVVFMGDYDAFWQGNADVFLLRMAGWIGLLGYAGSALFVRWVQLRFQDHDPSLV